MGFAVRWVGTKGKQSSIFEKDFKNEAEAKYFAREILGTQAVKAAVFSFSNGRVGKIIQDEGEFAANRTTLTYGQLPTKKAFMSIYAQEMGDIDYKFFMTLRGKADTSAANNTVFEDAIDVRAEFDADEMWKGLNQLKRKFDRGNDKAGDLASGILETLHIEWV